VALCTPDDEASLSGNAWAGWRSENGRKIAALIHTGADIVSDGTSCATDSIVNGYSNFYAERESGAAGSRWDSPLGPFASSATIIISSPPRV